MRYTEEQLQAIELRGTNVLLSAAAGSGKTTVLVERVLRLIVEDGADVDVNANIKVSHLVEKRS